LFLVPGAEYAVYYTRAVLFRGEEGDNLCVIGSFEEHLFGEGDDVALLSGAQRAIQGLQSVYRLLVDL